jgi:hypothetical protein
MHMSYTQAYELLSSTAEIKERENATVVGTAPDETGRPDQIDLARAETRGHVPAGRSQLALDLGRTTGTVASLACTCMCDRKKLAMV